MKKKIIAVIPARGGSKGIPRKNLYPLNGKPLIHYSIQAALDSRLVTDIIVTTDSEKIKKVAESYGLQVPFLRPAELSNDTALAVPTIQHAVNSCESINNCKYDYVIMLQPTAPLREAFDIDAALQMLIDKNGDGIISIVNVDNNHPIKMKVIRDEKLFDFQETGLENPPRQSLPPIYIVNGAIYATKRDVLMNANSFKGSFCLPYIMPAERSVNIDNMPDFIVAEYYINKKYTEGN